MGSRGPQAHTTRRAPHKNSRPNAATRKTEITENSPGFWDLAVGGNRHWPDAFCAERKAAWAKWRDTIMRRWPIQHTNGERPAAWFDFEAPRLAKLNGLDPATLDDMSNYEVVYRLDASETERARIEAMWRRGIEHATAYQPNNVRAHATGAYRVPEWFYDQVSKE
jgi:hypothetical protein